MSLRHALLGLLTERPQTGYDLSKRFEQSLSRYAWQASHSRIYPELKELAADGLVEVVDEGARSSRTYAITPRGSEELREWMFTPKDASVRNEYVLRLFLLSALETEDVRTLVRDVIERADAGVAELRQTIERMEAEAEPGARPPFSRFAVEFGLRTHQLQADWGRWVLSVLDGLETSTNA